MCIRIEPIIKAVQLCDSSSFSVYCRKKNRKKVTEKKNKAARFLHVLTLRQQCVRPYRSYMAGHVRRRMPARPFMNPRARTTEKPNRKRDVCAYKKCKSAKSEFRRYVCGLIKKYVAEKSRDARARCFNY